MSQSNIGELKITASQRLRSQKNITVPLGPIAAFCRRWKITELALFGSVLRDGLPS
jgi:predicted nucleotidyltransferase